jgi:hypothetical protein
LQPFVERFGIITNREDRMKSSHVKDTRDVFDILSALWIIASNDTNPLIAYEGIKHRLNLPVGYELEELVQKRGELFRNHISLHSLEEWKAVLLANPSSRPSWIHTLGDESFQKTKIESLTVNDAFQSQFRGASGDPSRSPIEIVDWGLQHIERLRKASLETREESIKRWQLWSVLIISVTNIIITIVVAIFK